MELPKTNEDSLIALGAKAKETGNDSFLVKIERKGQYGLPESLTSCEGVELKFIIKPEVWLPTLFGGGNFILTCYHVSELTMPLAKLVLNFRGEPQMNWTALDGGTWSGPKNFTRREPSAGTTFAEGELGGGRDRRPPGYGGSSHVPQGEGNYRWMFEQFSKQQEKTEALFRDALKAQQQPAKPSLGAAEIAALVGAVTAPVVGLIGTFVSSGQTARLEQARITAENQKERDRMFAEQQKERDRMIEAQQKESREMFRALATPKPVDPIIERLVNDQRKLFEKLSEGGSGESEQMAQMMNVMQTMFGFTSKAISAAAEAQLGGEKGGGWLPAFREAITGLEHIFTARMQQPRPPGTVAQPQLPPAQAQAAQPAQPIPAGSEVEQVFQAILRHEDAHTVATRIIALAENDEPSFVAAIGQFDNDIIKLAEATLGSVQDNGGMWLLQPTHQFYLRTILMEIEKSPVFGGPEVPVQPVSHVVAPATRSEASTGGSATPAAPTPTVEAEAPAVVDFNKAANKKRKLEKPSPDA